MKIAARVEELKTKIKLSFSAHMAEADAFSQITARLSARGS